MTDLNNNHKEVKRELEAKLQSIEEEVDRWKSKCQTLETQLKEVSCLIKLVFNLKSEKKPLFFAKYLKSLCLFYSIFFPYSEWLILAQKKVMLFVLFCSITFHVYLAELA